MNRYNKNEAENKAKNETENKAQNQAQNQTQNQAVNQNKNQTVNRYPEIPDRMFQDVRIPEALAPTPINPGIDEANQINIPRNPASPLHALDWDIPDEPQVTDPGVPATPNPHTNPHENRKKNR